MNTSDLTVSIPLHSQTDLITNSSTTIYTYSDASPAACREMIEAIFKAFEIDKKCDDVFHIVLMMENEENYEYWLEDQGHDIEGDLSELLNKVRSGKVEKPKWMFDAEKSRHQGTVLHISAKSKKYVAVANLIKKFLYSTETKEIYD
ncbi:hypothetical protein M0R72_02885 [Candidatus Pacearchaeota archaeon]|jgi:hypothetical protein|nr:hypothetical protein [Candidatus Pacearchaeota archaeon]